ncbi:MAG: electron transport complex subunit RsxC, partial [bacterium]|nr:electron transport complex subunit RsxC [bacterium]
KAVGDMPHPMGRDVPSVVIESDGEDRWFDGLAEVENFQDLSPDDLKARIVEAGIVGMGGATFPTHVKLSPPTEKPIDTVIINGVECEPYLTADHRLMVERPEEIIGGLEIFMQILGVSAGAIGIEQNKPDAIEIMTKLTAHRKDITVVPLKVKYPQGAEKQLIKAILNREVPSGGLPMDVGVVVQNVGTTAAVFKAVRFGMPVIDRITTVTGPGIKIPKNLRIRIGTPFSEIIEFCGGLKGKTGKVISGGPMMGMTQYSLDVPVIKGTSGILIFRDGDLKLRESNACIRCGKCLEICPMGINPSLLGVCVEAGAMDELEGARALDCMECGSCAFVCPAARPLVHLLRYGKADVLAKKKT